jgi:hypothetical protein
MMKNLIYILISAIILIFVSCNSKPSVKLDIPSRDIVYQAINYQHAGDPDNNNEVGFVNADGSGNALVNLEYRAHFPLFSKDLGGILFLESINPMIIDFNSGAGYIYLLDENGVYRNCHRLLIDDDKSYDGIVSPVRGMKDVLAFNAFNIDLFSMDSCEVTKKLVHYSDEVQDLMIGYAFPSSSGEQVIFGLYNRTMDKYSIQMIEMQTNQVKEIIPNDAWNPSFSPDDQKITFVEKDGIYTADMNGTNSKLLVPVAQKRSVIDNNIDIVPFWSPDGNWILYHKCIHQICENLSDFSIFKVNVQTGKETKIIENGLFPVWVK